jgi:hypothetical protein
VKRLLLAVELDLCPQPAHDLAQRKLRHPRTSLE